MPSMDKRVVVYDCDGVMNMDVAIDHFSDVDCRNIGMDEIDAVRPIVSVTVEDLSRRQRHPGDMGGCSNPAYESRPPVDSSS